MTRKCELCDVNRSSVYRKKQSKEDPTHGESAYNLKLMRLIDEIHYEHPSWGSRRIAAILRKAGYKANRKRIQTPIFA